jgi:predicted nucleotidyltransferase
MLVEREKNRIKVACLEDLIILKYRADREQDYEDLSDIAGTRFTKINWSLLQSLTKDEVEFSEIKNTMNIYRNR